MRQLQSTEYSTVKEHQTIPNNQLPEVFLQNGCEYGFDAIDGVQLFVFGNRTICSGRIESFRWRSTSCVMLSHPNTGINMGTNGDSIWEIVVTWGRNHRERESTNGLIPNQPNWKPSKDGDRTYNCSKVAGTFNCVRSGPHR